jgi:hypothetical protein
VVLAAQDEQLTVMLSALAAQVVQLTGHPLQVLLVIL